MKVEYRKGVWYSKKTGKDPKIDFIFFVFLLLAILIHYIFVA